MHLVQRFFFLIILLLGTFATPLMADDIPAYKVKVATDLMDALKEAKGILPGEKPYFFVVSELPSKNFKVAMAYPTYGEIFFEESAYDLCVRVFGPDSLKAMSVILSHELVHFMRKHGVVNHFAWQFDAKFTQDAGLISALESALPDNEEDQSGFLVKVESLLKKFETRKHEAEADLEGGFLSYLAGYPIGDVGPKLMDSIYSFYKIPAVLETYPTLAERRQIAERTAEKLKELQYWYEGANLLIVMGHYEAALGNYNRLLGQFQSREIYNNMGVIAMLAAEDLFEASERPLFVIPYSLDLHSRLSTSSRGGDDVKQKRDSLLRIAISYFQKASSLDGEYPLALLNEGCAQWLHANSWQFVDPVQSAEYLAKAKGLALQTERLTRTLDAWTGQERTIRSARILQAMCQYSEKDTLGALERLEQLSADAPGDDRITANLGVIHQVKPDDPIIGRCREDHPSYFKPRYVQESNVETIQDYFNLVWPTLTTSYLEPSETPSAIDSLFFGYVEHDTEKIKVYSWTWFDDDKKMYQVNIMWAPSEYYGMLPCEERLSDLDMRQLNRLYGDPKHTLPFANGILNFYPQFKAAYTDSFSPKILGWNNYGLIVMIEDEQPVQWGLTFYWKPE